MTLLYKLSSIALLCLLLAACGLLQPAPGLTLNPPATPSQIYVPNPTGNSPQGIPPTAFLPGQPVQPQAGRSTPEILKEMGGYPCSDNSDFTCVKLNVPLDQLNPKPDETMDVVFAVLPASNGRPKGMFVTAVGGPGSSGVASADSYSSDFDTSITDNFDIVFFDQRGVNGSGNLQCPKAAADYYRADWRASTPDEEAHLLQVAQSFSEGCVKEMSNPRLLPYLGTGQAVHDLEAFRQAMQSHGDVTAEKIWLYGESYGTQLAQTYAASFPGHLAALILDGTVDLTLSGLEVNRQQAQAFNDVLEKTLKACNADAACAKDVGGDAVAAYDRLAAALPQSFVFPLPSGKTEERMFTFSDLESAASGYLYNENDRLIFLRSLASAAAHNDLAPLARVLYDTLYLDPETQQAKTDPTYSDVVYYGVECSDYNFPGDTSQAAAQAYLRAGDELDKSLPHFASVFYGDLACAYWPTRTQNPARPAPLVAQGIPTLVLGATADPATPVDQGRGVFSRLADGYLVTVQGGAHIVFGRGDDCVDNLVTAFLVNGQPPTQRETACPGVIYDPYVPIAATDAKAYANPLDAMEAVDNEINYLPEYSSWDGDAATSVGCPFGGMLSFVGTDDGASFRLQNCSFSNGFSLSGKGTYNNDSEVLTFNVKVSGYAKGSLAYTRQPDGSLSVTGEYAGNPVDLRKKSGS